MAGSTNNIRLFFSLIDNKLNSGLNEVKNKVSKATGDMQNKLNAFKKSNIEAFNAIKDEVPGVSRALSLLSNPYVLIAAAAVAVAVAIGAATTKAMEFEHSFMNIRQLNLDKTRDELDKYRTQVIDTSLDVGINLNKMSQGYYDIQSALGVYGKDVADISKQVGKYSISTQADYNDSIGQTVKAMKAFGLQTGNVKSLLESNAKTVQVGIVTFAELARVQTDYAGDAAKMGQNVDTANKIFAAFTSIAKNAEVAATLTKTAFQGLADPNVLNAIGKYGVKVYDNTGKMRDLDKILKETSGKIAGMNDQSFNKFMGDVGGPEGLRALFGKLRTGADDFFKTLEAYDKSPVNLDKMYENALKDPATAAAVVKEQFNTMFTSFGLIFLPVVTKISNFLINTIKYFRDLYNESSLLRDSLSYIGAIISTAFSISLIPIKFIINGIKLIGEYWSWATSKIFGFGGGISSMYDKIRPFLIWIADMAKQIGGILYDAFTLNIWGLKDKLAAFKMPDMADIRQRISVESSDFNGVPGIDPTKPKTPGVNQLATDLQTTAAGSQTKSITINIDSFIKGFSPTHQSVNGMSKDELERWVTEMFLRVVRSAETTM
ncbi:MAG: phage tail tape measure protein [Bacteroidetes bacterium GWB2_41_8]|nr:MAG: phage tail tape measure protein [Bacteroidetes bacterium GWB2_41_8]